MNRPPPNTSRAWRGEAGVLLLLFLIVFGGYFARASAMSMRGEEARRAQVAIEMIDSGDWLVPREQGDPFFSRPPLQNWLIAACYLVSGERDAFGARLPSLVSVLLMVLILYGYGRSFLSRTGALAAAAAYATFAEVLQECRMAETEALFTLLVGGSLLVWHWGMTRGWPDAITWSLGYGLMALGMLAKSLQAPCYFLASVTVYLLITRQWRQLFSLSHLVGMAVGAGILAAWAIPYAQHFGLAGIRAIWMNDIRQRLVEWDGVLKHLVEFPVELFGCTLPWSPLLLAFCSRTFRAAIGSARPQVLFMTVILVLGVPTVWLPAHGMTRFLLPLYPCIAMLIGVVVDRCGEAAPESELGIGWRRYLRAAAAVMIVIAVAIPAMGWFRDSPRLGVFAESPFVACAFCVSILGLAWLTRTMASSARPWHTGAAVITLAAFMALLFTGPITNSRNRRGNDVGAEIAKLKAELPADVHLVSIGHIHSELPFFYRQQVRPLSVPVGIVAIGEGDYFCFNAHGNQRPTLPFAWEEVKAISVDRNKHDVPDDVVVVARRITTQGVALRRP